jgi:low affinity Fe/Cu permease
MIQPSRNTGTVLIIIGVLVLFLQVTQVNISWFAWPFLVMIPGILLLIAAFVSDKSAAGLAIPGSIVTMLGLILFLQNVTGRFESWSYAWALIPTAVGIGIFIQGVLTQNKKLRLDGSRLVMIGLILLLALGGFFELFIFNQMATGFVWRYLLPIVLIAAGLFLFMRSNNRRRTEMPPEPQA